MDGIERIASERKRQIEEEGWTAEHDDQHEDSGLAKAAASYAYPRTEGEHLSWKAALWPWADGWYRPCPNNRIRELEKAGALCAAEIDRLLRLKERKKTLYETAVFIMVA
jgi:hypothetical protein